MENLTKDKEFEAVKYRHEDQVKVLQYITTLDDKMYAGFLAIQLAFGGFLTQTKIDHHEKIGLFIIDIIIGIICGRLLYCNHKRREEIIETIKNCNKALGYEEQDKYISGTLNAPTKTRPWINMFLIGILATFIGIYFILFCSKNQSDGNKNTSIIVNLTINRDTIMFKSDTTIIISGQKNSH